MMVCCRLNCLNLRFTHGGEGKREGRRRRRKEEEEKEEKQEMEASLSKRRVGLSTKEHLSVLL